MLWTRERNLSHSSLSLQQTFNEDFAPSTLQEKGCILLVCKAFYHYYHGGDVAISLARKHISLFEKYYFSHGSIGCALEEGDVQVVQLMGNACKNSSSMGFLKNFPPYN